MQISRSFDCTLRNTLEKSVFSLSRALSVSLSLSLSLSLSGDTTPYRMTGVTLHSHVRYKEM